MTVAYKTAITGTILSVTAVTLLIPPNTAIAIPMIRIMAKDIRLRELLNM